MRPDSAMKLMALPLICFSLSAVGAQDPPGVNEHDRLLQCRGSRNCVSSSMVRQHQFVEPIRFAATPEEAFACLEKVIVNMDRARVTFSESGLLRVEFRTRMGFVDDAVFVLRAQERVIHMRSESRVGYWDLGVNRRRLESIRGAFQSACSRGSATSDRDPP